jgi:hypothetical protein
VGFFGPLVDGVVVARPLLAPLVRATAINAYRRVRVAEAPNAAAPYALQNACRVAMGHADCARVC